MKKKISITIPCYNEEENARPIYEAVRDEMEKELPDVYKRQGLGLYGGSACK